MPTDNTAPGSMVYELMTGTILQSVQRWVDEELLRSALAVCEDSYRANCDAAQLVEADKPSTYAKRRLIEYHDSATRRACALRDQIHKLLQSQPTESPAPSITITTEPDEDAV